MVVGQSSVTMFRYSLDTSKTDQTLVQKSEASSRRGQLELMRLHRREAEAETFQPPLLPLIISSSSSSSSPPSTTSLSLFHRTTYPSCCTSLSASGKRRTCPDASALVKIPSGTVRHITAIPLPNGQSHSSVALPVPLFTPKVHYISSLL